jgi:nitrate reductase beta subunit
MQIPVRYLANLLTAGDEEPVVRGLEKMFAMRIFMRDRHVEGKENLGVLAQAGTTVEEIEEMYRYFAIAKFDDRFVIPTRHREIAAELGALEGIRQSGCSISDGPGGHAGGGCGSSLPRLFQIEG